MRLLIFPYHILKRKLSYCRISEIYDEKLLNEEKTIKGWIKSIRHMKTRIFFDVNDGSTFKTLQVVANKNEANGRLTYGSAVEVCGKITHTPSGQIELQTTNVKIIGGCDVEAGYPFVPRTKYKPQEIRDHLHFRPRTTSFGSMMRIRNRASQCVHQFFQNENFTGIHTPVLTSNDCEGAGEIFAVVPESQRLIDEMRKENKTDAESFFDTLTFMTVSGQLHLEVMARALSRVYQFGPVFRAENSHSRLHLSEFYMIEAELAFLNSIEDLLLLIENLIKFVTRQVLSTHEEEIRNYRKLLALPELTDFIDKPFVVMDFNEACQILENHNYSFECGRRLSKEHELFLVKYADNTPVFIVNWPPESKPFYVKLDGLTVKALAVDLLFPEVGELCGGSLREDDYDSLKNKLITSNFLTKLSWYLDLRKFGNVPTGGFGMGFERYLKVLMGTANVKDTIPFPRWPHNCLL